MRQTLYSPVFHWLVCQLTVPVLFMTGIATPPQRQAHKPSEHSQLIEVGMVALLAAPQKYDGKVIRTTGFMCLEFEGNALYLHEEDYRYRMRKNAVELNLSKAQEKQFKGLSLKHVIIEGTVFADESGVRRGMYSGAIGKITRLEYWRPRGDIPVPPQEPPSSCSR